jgi:hypothetical protein
MPRRPSRSGKPPPPTAAFAPRSLLGVLVGMRAVRGAAGLVNAGTAPKTPVCRCYNRPRLGLFSDAARAPGRDISSDAGRYVRPHTIGLPLNGVAGWGCCRVRRATGWVAQPPPLWPPGWHQENDSGRSPGWENGLFEWVELRGLEPLTPTLPEGLGGIRGGPQEFISARQMHVMSSVDADGRAWTPPFGHHRGTTRRPSDRTLKLPPPGRPDSGIPFAAVHRGPV